MVMTHTHAKSQRQRSVGLKDRVERDGWADGWMDKRTDRGDCITSHANAVDKNLTLHNST